MFDSNVPNDENHLGQLECISNIFVMTSTRLRLRLGRREPILTLRRPSSVLVHRVVIRESRHRPGARNGRYYGLMQMAPATARGMGYSGSPQGLLDAETNLKYGVKYLRGAYLVADGNHDAAVKWYSRGYYYEAKRKGLLEEAGLR